MKRREFLAGLVGVSAVSPGVLRAQPAMRRVGVFLGASTEGDADARLNKATLEAVLQKLGWSEGRNVHFEYRYSAGDPARMSAHVAELVKFGPDVIVVRGNRPAVMMKQATGGIPVVFAQVGDPVGSGIVDNLARPGGNVTGFTHFEPSMGGKWLETLKEIAPAVGRVIFLMHPETPANIAFLRVAEKAALALGIALAPAGVRDAADVERAIAAAAGSNAGLAVMPHDVTVAQHALIVALAARRGLPAVYPYRFYVAEGGLVSYSFDTADHWRQVGSYVARILRGEKPADLPVQAPTKFELVVNLKTAKALGLAVPATFLGRADEVIE